jgi:CHAT domain-containing protein
VLIEDYNVALVPYGQFLAAGLIDARPASRVDGALLAVADVQYDKPGRSIVADDMSLAQRSYRHEVLTRGGQVRWAALKGSKSELASILDVAAERAKPELTLTDTEASTDAVLQALPRARWAHLATHGFFADAKFRSMMQVAEEDFRDRIISFGGERTTFAGRNPLVLSGLVLAGAGLPRKTDEWGMPVDDGGILTAEAIASLPLTNLDLAVLSACETGLGDVAGGEGVFGLQRAFHIAGARNVIATLWRVDDNATAALMRLFYDNLWRNQKPPIVALREAQLAIYRNPKLIGAPGTSMGPDLSKTVPLPKNQRRTNPSGKAHLKAWAGLVISGVGD